MNKQSAIHQLYKRLLGLYPREFKERFSASMLQTFNDLYQEKQSEGKWLSFIPWLFVETLIGIAKEHTVRLKGDLMQTSTNLRLTALVSSILLAVSFILAPMIYLVGNLRDAMGPFTYNLADFLYGPVWAASLISIVFVLRERIGEYAPRRMSLALWAAILAAATMILIACVRSANRQYHLLHPELHLEESTTVLIVWGTLLTGLTGAGWHFLGWALTLVGSAGWTSRQLPRLLSGLYMATGITAWFVYLLPVNEGLATLLGVIVIIWQGILLWKVEPQATLANQPE
jgi:hypothetical protein